MSAPNDFLLEDFKFSHAEKSTRHYDLMAPLDSYWMLNFETEEKLVIVML